MRKFIVLFSSCMMFLIGNAYSQSLISGKVTDDRGNGIPNATILEKGTRNATSADLRGNFKIKVASSATLIISATGYETKSVEAVNNVQAVLAVDSKALTEVVVTGTGVAVSKKKLATAVESVDIAKQTKVSTGNVLDQLVGQVAGAQISSVSGSPGQAPSIVLRGINTINRGTNPMIILDGVQLAGANLNQIDLNTIERVEVVQGGAAATMYGAQGANGVIQLFSKKGRQGTVNIDFSISNTSAEFLNIGNLRKNQFHSYGTNANNEVLGTAGGVLTWNPAIGAYTDNVVVNLIDPTATSSKPYNQNLKYYDHYDMFWKKANNKSASLSISGGKEKMDFAITGSYNTQESNFKNNGGLKRGNLTNNLGFELFKNFKIRSVTQFIYDVNTVNWDRSIIYSINNARPFANFDERMSNGQHASYFGGAVGVNHLNPNYYQENSTSNVKTGSIVQSFNANYRFAKFVELDVKYGINYTRGDQEFKYPDQRTNPNIVNFGGASYGVYNFSQGFTGELDIRKTQNISQNFMPTVTVTTDFQRDFRIKVPIKTTTLLAFDYRKTESKDYYVYGIGEAPFTPNTLTNYSTQRVTINTVTPFITYGFLADQRFEFGDYAGISAGIRSDYSSAFGRGSTPQTFPHVNGFFRPSQLNFWNKMGNVANVITDVKLRAAYGAAGIQPLAFQRYPILSTRAYGANQSLSTGNTMNNTNLDVEISKETEFGTDISLKLGNGKWFRNVNLSYTYWKRSTENAIYDVDVAPSSGLGAIPQNAFSLAATGSQFSINATVFQDKKINWNLTVNYGNQSSEITKVVGSDVVLLSSAGSTNYVLRPGLKIGQLFGYKLLTKVDQKDINGNLVIPAANHGNYEVASNGYVVDKNTKLPVADPVRVSLGDPNPKFNMSFINDISYGGYLTFNMQWDWVYKSHLYNQTKSWMYRDGIHSDYEKPITINGQTGAWTAFYRGIYQVGAFNGTKEYFYEDASFLRLRNISMGLDLAKLKAIKGLRKLQLVVSARNLMTLTKYTGFDPEISSGAVTGNGGSSWDRGTDHNTMPNLKFFTVGLNVGL
jgi:TonB-dependent starch-binding outer membrane protein SusC